MLPLVGVHDLDHHPEVVSCVNECRHEVTGIAGRCRLRLGKGITFSL